MAYYYGDLNYALHELNKHYHLNRQYEIKNPAYLKLDFLIYGYITNRKSRLLP